MSRLKILLSLVFFVWVTGICLNAKAEEVEIIPSPNEEEVTGRIEEINYETRMMLLKSYEDEEQTIYREDNIYVLEEALIEKDSEVIHFKDLRPGQEITVRYDVSVEGEKEALDIWVLNE